MGDWRRPLGLVASCVLLVLGCGVVLGIHVEAVLAALVVGAIGAVLTTAGVLAIQHARLARRLRGAGSRIETDGVVVDVVPGVMPLVAGLLRPRIFADDQVLAELDAAHRQAVFLHEQAHRDRFDPARLVVLEAIGRCLGWMPAVRSFEESARARMEIRADRHAIDHGVRRGDLAGALLHLADRSQGVGAAAFGAVTEQRLHALLGDPDPAQGRPRWWWIAVVVLLVSVTVTCVTLSSGPHAEVMWVVGCVELTCPM